MPKAIKKDTIHAKGIDIGIYTTDFENEFISLTDIAKYRNVDDPRFVIQNWMRNRNTIEFLAVWETLHNPDFNRVQFEAVKNEAGLNRFVMTPTKWIEQMNAKGIVSKSGRYGGGTYAHSDIALSFASWISPEFQLYIMKDYRRLKFDENSRLSLDWNLNREIAKLNYRIHTDAIKAYLIPPELTPEQISYKYANEADKAASDGRYSLIINVLPICTCPGLCYQYYCKAPTETINLRYERITYEQRYFYQKPDR